MKIISYIMTFYYGNNEVFPYVDNIKDLYNNGLSYNDIEVKYIYEATEYLECYARKYNIQLYQKCYFGYVINIDEFVLAYICLVPEFSNNDDPMPDCIMFYYKIQLEDIQISQVKVFKSMHFYAHQYINNIPSIYSDLFYHHDTNLVSFEHDYIIPM